MGLIVCVNSDFALEVCVLKLTSQLEPHQFAHPLVEVTGVLLLPIIEDNLRVQRVQVSDGCLAYDIGVLTVKELKAHKTVDIHFIFAVPKVHLHKLHEVIFWPKGIIVHKHANFVLLGVNHPILVEFSLFRGQSFSQYGSLT